MVATGRRRKLSRHTRAHLPDVEAEFVYIDVPCRSLTGNDRVDGSKKTLMDS